MKRLLLLTCMLISLSAISQRKLGLIIAVGEYPTNGGWKSLSSINDIKYIKAALLQNGFTERDIDTLLNQRATKMGILKSLDDLIQKAQTGDVVVFHFSGHGQQIFDDNNDETDGYDEALIPYDAAAYYDPVTYKGEKHLRDDELGNKLNLIRAKIGATGSLVVIVDACHSGTATRGSEIFQARGNPVPFNKPGYKPNIKVSFASNTSADEFFGNGVGNMIVFSASSPHQVNFETKDNENAGVGSLSYAFARAVAELKPGSTYQYLFEKIRAQIQAKFPQQIPMIEGNVNQEVFGGKFIPPMSYIGIQKWMSDTSILINAGFLNNTTKGTKFTLYALNDKDETTPMAEGYITVAGSFQSVGTIDNKLAKGEAYKVKIDESGFGDFTAVLSFRAGDEKAKQPMMLISQVKRFISPYQYLSVGENPDYIFEIKSSKAGTDTINLIDKSDSTRWNVTLKKGDTLSQEKMKQMLDNLKRAMRINYLRNMADGGTLVQNVTVEIIPVNPSNVTGTDIWMKAKDMFNIKITNKNNYPVYFNLIDLMPNNEVKVLIPYEGTTAEDFAIQPNAEFLIEEIEVDEGTPLGREFMKFIFTKTAMDLRPVLSRSATRSAAHKSGVENVLDDMFKDNPDQASTRSSIVRPVKVDEVGVITRSFSIKR
jgi:metacaspase-1